MKEERLYTYMLKYFRNECTPEEVTQLKSYLSDKKIKDSMFLRILERIEEQEYLDYPHYSGVQFDEQSVLTGIKDKLNLSDRSLDESAPSKLRGNRFSQLFRIAASISIIAFTIWFIYHGVIQDNQKAEVPVADKWQEIETLRGQIRTITLSDGSKIKLNVASKIRFHKNFTKQPVREIYLTGEAFFEVSKMENKPFVVFAKGMKTSVLGTSFNIDAYKENEDFKIAVVEGKVNVSHVEGKDMLYLQPDEMAVWGSKKIEKFNYDHDLVLGWTNRALVFRNADFSTIKAELEKWYDVDIEIVGTISARDYSATHRNQSLEVLLEGLAFAANFSYNINVKKVTLYAN